jgi:hypothetical protein
MTSREIREHLDEKMDELRRQGGCPEKQPLLLSAASLEM